MEELALNQFFKIRGEEGKAKTGERERGFVLSGQNEEKRDINKAMLGWLRKYLSVSRPWVLEECTRTFPWNTTLKNEASLGKHERFSRINVTRFDPHSRGYCFLDVIAELLSNMTSPRSHWILAEDGRPTGTHVAGLVSAAAMPRAPQLSEDKLTLPAALMRSFIFRKCVF